MPGITPAGTAVTPVAAGWPITHGILVPSKFWRQMIRIEYAMTFLRRITTPQIASDVKNEGDEVVIRTGPVVQVRRGAIGGKPQYDVPVPTAQTLKVDRIYDWGFVVDDVERAQSDLDYVAEYQWSAGENTMVVMEEDYLATQYTTCAASNAGATAGAKSGQFNLGATGSILKINKGGTNGAVAAVDVLTRMRAVLSERNVPQGQMIFAMLPVWFTNMLFNSTLTYANAQVMGDDKSVLRTGELKPVAGVTPFETNLLAQTVDGGSVATEILFGCPDAVAFAMTMTKADSLKDKDIWGMLYRGRQVAGWKTVRDWRLGHVHAMPWPDA